jgi:hypothetical protein
MVERGGDAGDADVIADDPACKLGYPAGASR